MWLLAYNNKLCNQPGFNLTGHSLVCTLVVCASALKALSNLRVYVDYMYKNDSGKLTVYASTAPAHSQRLMAVKAAAEKMAQQLNIDFEMVEQTKGVTHTYVYYENGGDEPVPLYCDEGKNDDLQEICAKLKNMMFVLSFHPKHTALKQVRSSIMTFS